MLLVVAMVVTLVVSLLVLVGAWRGRATELLPPQRTAGGLRWIVIGGIIVPTVILAAVFVFTMVTQAAVAAPAGAPAVTVQITGHQWWWEVHYLDRSPSRIAVTANEIHIPVGQPVRFELLTGDVIHSFWIPELGGKTDLIPGQKNVMWLEADSAGRLSRPVRRVLRDCSTRRWRCRSSPSRRGSSAGGSSASGSRPRRPPDPDAAAGERVFASSACALCHAVRGTLRRRTRSVPT